MSFSVDIIIPVFYQPQDFDFFIIAKDASGNFRLIRVNK
jgi:hypothetical protein